jgi:hypothetical protein
MNAMQTATATATVATPAALPNAPRVPMLGALRWMLLAEAAATLALAVFLSLLAAAMRDFLGGDSGRAAEETLRFAAGGSFLFAIFAAVAARGVRRARRWSWTMAAMLQAILAIGTGVAVMVAEWHPAFLAGFAVAAVVMLVLSTPSVRRGLGQA